MICEFCGISFEPRPQVKNPRACDHPNCQFARQRANEREWHEKHKEAFDASYHRACRRRRGSFLAEAARSLVRALAKGIEILGLRVDLNVFARLLIEYMGSLGVRRVNKFWNA